MGYDQDEIRMLARQTPKLMDKLDQQIAVRVPARQKTAMQLLEPAKLRALIVCAVCRELDDERARRS